MALWKGKSYTNATGRKHRSRTHRPRALSPLALAISLLVILTAYSALAIPSVSASPTLTPCPGPGGWKVPNCIHFTASVPTNSTNSTIRFELPNIGAYVTLVWGNTTNYGFYGTNSLGQQIKNVLYSSGTWYSSFIDFLKPSTTYYYKFTGNYSGFSMGTQTGSWTTGSDSMTTLSGTVTDLALRITRHVCWGLMFLDALRLHRREHICHHDINRLLLDVLSPRDQVFYWPRVFLWVRRGRVCRSGRERARCVRQPRPHLLDSMGWALERDNSDVGPAGCEFLVAAELYWSVASTRARVHKQPLRIPQLQ